MGFNKGEWSELYSFLYLLENPNLIIVDENLQVIKKDLFRIIKILIDENIFEIKNNRILKTKKVDQKPKVIYNYDVLNYISKQKDILLNKILTHTSSKGSFEINEILPLINGLLDGKKIKGNSNVKGDLEATILDNQLDRIVNLNYNIKSSLGSPATLLNASNNTNFIYEITNIDDNIMNQSNLIKNGTKLLDRCKFLLSHNANINFIKVQSDIFYFNLKLIDSNLDKILADILLLSYQNNEKDIKKLLNLISSNNDEYCFYKKKISDFANAVTFGMRAGEKWNGINEVNGGIILVTKTGEVYLLDLVYFEDIVNKYLIDNIKLDSPSSSRYKMFNIYKENGKYYFKLNLQVRFK